MCIDAFSKAQLLFGSQGALPSAMPCGNLIIIKSDKEILMESFKHRGKEVEFWRTTGEVLSQNKYSETHVSQSGGGVGYVGKYGGYVSAPKIHSTTVTNHEFWIKQEDGSEKSFKLSGHDIPIREGQRISIITAGLKGSDSNYHSILVNHDTHEHWLLNNAKELNKHLKIDDISGKSLLIAGGLWWLVALVSTKEIGAIVAVGFIIYRTVTKGTRIDKMLKALSQHLEELVQVT